MSDDKSKIAEEMKKMEYEPLLPAEITLVKWSICLGVGLLIMFYFLSQVLFPGGH
jgi:hypothetical protein